MSQKNENDNKKMNFHRYVKKDIQKVEKKIKSKNEVTKLSKQNIKKIIAVISGKGGVGKSSVSSIIALKLNSKGKKVVILDSDITGASILNMFSINKKAEIKDKKIIPAISKTGIKISSINMFLKSDDNPIIWRGPMLSNALIQLYRDTLWQDLDYLIIDMPPSTSDIMITSFQSIPIDSAIVVTTAQSLAINIAKKAYNMAKQMNINVIGFIENMSYITCGKCGNNILLYGEDMTKQLVENVGSKLIAKFPLDINLNNSIINHNFEQYVKSTKYFTNFLNIETNL